MIRRYITRKCYKRVRGITRAHNTFTSYPFTDDRVDAFIVNVRWANGKPISYTGAIRVRNNFISFGVKRIYYNDQVTIIFVNFFLNIENNFLDIHWRNPRDCPAEHFENRRFKVSPDNVIRYKCVPMHTFAREFSCLR